MPEILAETSADLSTSTGKQAIVDIWTREIENALEKEKDWRAEAQEYFKIYKNSAKSEDMRYNILYANTETLKPLVYSKLPQPNITRRFTDKGDIARILSEMMERSVSYFLEESGADTVFQKMRDDFLIGGRGLPRVVFDPEDVLEIENKSINEEGEEITEIEEDIDPETKKVRIEYVPWADFTMSPENVWEDVRWIAFRHKMSRDQLVNQFGKVGEKVNLDHSSISEKNNSDKNESEIFKFAEVWEIWDKQTERVIFLTTGQHGSILSDEEDTYNLKGFFPIPSPLGSSSDPECLVPIPLYRWYRMQAASLNTLDIRIEGLTQQLKYTGVFDGIAKAEDVANLMNGADGEFNPLPTTNPNSNINQSIYVKDIGTIAAVIDRLENRKLIVLQNIRDITGLSDIVRGTTIASETATAQQLKGNFAISRIQPIQRATEQTIANVIKLAAELIVENYTVRELAIITNLLIVDINLIAEETRKKQQALFEEAMQGVDMSTPEGQEQEQQLKQQMEAGFKKTMAKPINDLKGYAATPEQLEEIEEMMKDDKLRSFAIDVETDSTISADQDAEKQDRVEYVNAISQFSSQFFPLVQAGVIQPKTFNEFLGFISRPFKVGRNLEEHLLAEPEEKEPEQPSMEEQLAQAENARQDQKLQLDAQKQQTDADQNQQKINIEKAKVKVDIEQFNDKIEFEDVNKEADRRAKTVDEQIRQSASIAGQQIRESDIV
jgi:hypothetical protein